MYDVMLDEAKLWFDESSQRQRKLVDNSPPSPPLVYEDSDDDEVDPMAEEKYRRQVIESGVILLNALLIHRLIRIVSVLILFYKMIRILVMVLELAN